MQLDGKGYFFTLLMYGLFSAISVQQSVRDRLDGIPVTNIYNGLASISVMLCLLLTTIGLWYSSITLAEKGFYAMAYLLSIFAAITVQNQSRDSVKAAALVALPQQDYDHQPHEERYQDLPG